MLPPQVLQPGAELQICLPLPSMWSVGRDLQHQAAFASPLQEIAVDSFITGELVLVLGWCSIFCRRNEACNLSPAAE